MVRSKKKRERERERETAMDCSYRGQKGGADWFDCDSWTKRQQHTLTIGRMSVPIRVFHTETVRIKIKIDSVHTRKS